LKLAYLLAQYLYTNKRLDLPGIGTFLLDSSVIIEPENSKQRSGLPEGISFESNSSIKDAPELISYISSKSGKMKALAIADLESHLQQVQQYLNIGKPFSFDGIGSLVKLKNGKFEFIPGTINTEKLKDVSHKEKHTLTHKETIEEKYQSYLSTPVAKSRWRKPVIVLLVLCGIGFAIWGGYTISNQNSETEDTDLIEASTEQTLPVADSSQLYKTDTTTPEKANIKSDNYKYVLEVAKSKRAFKRYNQLKDNFWDVQLETNDSIQYKLFMMLPANTDTTRVMDSLTVLTGRKVYIENQN
jgi:Icc-related predicted phosphoesterase